MLTSLPEGFKFVKHLKEKPRKYNPRGDPLTPIPHHGGIRQLRSNLPETEKSVCLQPLNFNEIGRKLMWSGHCKMAHFSKWIMLVCRPRVPRLIWILHGDSKMQYWKLRLRLSNVATCRRLSNRRMSQYSLADNREVIFYLK